MDDATQHGDKYHHEDNDNGNVSILLASVLLRKRVGLMIMTRDGSKKLKTLLITTWTSNYHESHTDENIHNMVPARKPQMNCGVTENIYFFNSNSAVIIR